MKFEPVDGMLLVSFEDETDPETFASLFKVIWFKVAPLGVTPQGYAAISADSSSVHYRATNGSLYVEDNPYHRALLSGVDPKVIKDALETLAEKDAVLKKFNDLQDRIEGARLEVEASQSKFDLMVAEATQLRERLKKL